MSPMPCRHHSLDIESFKLVIEEQRRNYDYLLHIYNRMRATESVLLAATVGIIAYVYIDPNGNGAKTTLTERLLIPDESYGQVIYFIALGFFVFGVARLTLNVFGDNPWDTAYETARINYSNKPLKNLRYMKKRYDECQKLNAAAYTKRKDQLRFLFFCIFISAIILISIRTLS